MSAQLLIYETAVPLSASRHGDLSVDLVPNYRFSERVNSVPLMAIEFPQAASEYAIVFAGEKNAFLPAVILGMRDAENLYVPDGATWDARYIPAFVRRYPFVFSTGGDEQRLVLCIDEAFSGCNRDGRGQALFAGGKPTPYVTKVLDFLQEYQNQFRRTQAFCSKLADLDLLEPMQAQIDMDAGQRLQLGGFMAVDRAKLKGLGGDKLAELVRTDEMELLYLHLQSMRNFTRLPERIAALEGGRAKRDSAQKAVSNGTSNGVSNGIGHSPAQSDAPETRPEHDLVGAGG